MMGVNTDFIHSEALADTYLSELKEIKSLLLEGKKEQCLSALNALQEAMSLTLAISEYCSSERVH